MYGIIGRCHCPFISHFSITMDSFSDFWFMNNVYTIALPVCAYFSFRWGKQNGINELLAELEEQGIIEFEDDDDEDDGDYGDYV